MDLPTTTIQPSAPHTHTIVFLHGRGDTAKEFAASLNHSRDSHKCTLQEIFPSFRWVFPQTEMRECAAFPGNKISQWFDIWDVEDFSDREELQAKGLGESVASIRRLLSSEATILGGKWYRIVLAGISQGAATSVHTLLNLNISPAVDGQEEIPRRLGAFLGEVLALDSAPDTDEVIRNTPVLLEHCVDDPLVLVENGKILRDTLREFGAQVTWKEYSNGGHWFNSPAGIDDAVEFLNNHVLKNMEAGGNGSSFGSTELS